MSMTLGEVKKRLDKVTRENLKLRAEIARLNVDNLKMVKLIARFEAERDGKVEGRGK